MAQVHVPRSLVALFPGVPRRMEIDAGDLASLIRELDVRYPGMWDRLCEPGPRLRTHINAFVDGRPARLDARLSTSSVVHIIPAVSGGADPSRPAIGTLDVGSSTETTRAQVLTGSTISRRQS